MNFIWSSGGGMSLFDPYSLYHIVFFVALTLVFYNVFEKHVWAAMLSISFIWEICEYWLFVNINKFPYVGGEGLINKCIGDPISNFLGVAISIYFINLIKTNSNS